MPVAIASVIIQSSILLAGVVDDLKTRKVHNWLVLVLSAIALISTALLYGIPALKYSFLSAGVALGVTLPLVLARVMGAGDMKLLIAFAFASSPMTIIWVTVYSFVWGALLGVFRALLNKNGNKLFGNTLALVTKSKKPDVTELTKIPYTVALFFGWLTHLSLNGFTSGGVL